MQSETTVTRRGFISGTALGIASMGLGLTSVLDAEVLRPSPQPTPAEMPILRLDRNESAYGMSPSSTRAMLDVAADASPRYPRDEPAALVDAISKRLGVEKEQVLLGCGSTEILKMATETFCSPSGAAIVAEPTFEAVVNYCPLARARAVKITLTKDYKHDLARMLDAAGLVGGFIFFCNPANPAGTFIDKQAVERFVHAVPSGVVLLIDEAYSDYVDTPEYESCLRYVKEGLPVLVSHTFSKVYGMAGLRIGYAVGHKDLIRQMSEHRLATSTNQLATAAARAGLNDDEFVARIRKLNSEVRNYLYGELKAMRLEFIPSQTNFVMINLGRPAQPVIDALKERGIMVGRLFPSMPNHMRVSLGTADETKVFVKEFKSVMTREQDVIAPV
jgi:histidinol-phosphate aminotransferase